MSLHESARTQAEEQGDNFPRCYGQCRVAGVSLSRNNKDVFRSEISGEEGVRPDTHRDPCGIMVSEWVDQTNKQLDLEAAKAKGSKTLPKACICNRLISISKLM